MNGSQPTGNSQSCAPLDCSVGKHPLRRRVEMASRRGPRRVDRRIIRRGGHSRTSSPILLIGLLVARNHGKTVVFPAGLPNFCGARVGDAASKRSLFPSISMPSPTGSACPSRAELRLGRTSRLVPDHHFPDGRGAAGLIASDEEIRACRRTIGGHEDQPFWPTVTGSRVR